MSIFNFRIQCNLFLEFKLRTLNHLRIDRVWSASNFSQVHNGLLLSCENANKAAGASTYSNDVIYSSLRWLYLQSSFVPLRVNSRDCPEFRLIVKPTSMEFAFSVNMALFYIFRALLLGCRARGILFVGTICSTQSSWFAFIRQLVNTVQTWTCCQCRGNASDWLWISWAIYGSIIIIYYITFLKQRL